MFNHWQIQGGWAKGAVLALLELRAMCKIGEGEACLLQQNTDPGSGLKHCLLNNSG